MSGAVVVALLAEGVDRNNLCRGQVARLGESPSSQRAWIEICTRSALVLSFVVALLAEGVDRNYKGLRKYEKAPVALLAEGVDRNRTGFIKRCARLGRPPRRGRG